jgi:hypothetical protein
MNVVYHHMSGLILSSKPERRWQACLQVWFVPLYRSYLDISLIDTRRYHWIYDTFDNLWYNKDNVWMCTLNVAVLYMQSLSSKLIIMTVIWDGSHWPSSTMCSHTHTHDTVCPELQTRWRIKGSEKDEGNGATVSTKGLSFARVCVQITLCPICVGISDYESLRLILLDLARKCNE